METVGVINFHGLESQSCSLIFDEKSRAIVDGNGRLTKSLNIVLLGGLEGKGIRLHLFNPLGFLELIRLLL